MKRLGVAPRLYVDFKKKRIRAPRINAALKRVMKRVQKDPTPSDFWDAQAVAHELAEAAEQYLAFFERCAESPKVNAVRHRVQGLIKKVRG